MTSNDQTAPAVVTRPRAHPADAPERQRRALAALAQMYAYFGPERT